MNITEIISGTLAVPNIPDFSKATKECVTDGYDIMSTTFKGKYAIGIVDDNGAPMSYCLLDPSNNGLNRLYEIYTASNYRGRNLAGIILMALKGELGITFFIEKDDVVSDDGRRLLVNMCKAGKLTAKLGDNTPITFMQLQDIFKNPITNDISLIFEGHELRRELDENRQGKINSWWYLRDHKTNMAVAGLDMDATE